MASTKPKPLPTWATFTVAGGSGVTAWLFVHPADVLKVRMQLMGSAEGGGVGAAARTIVQEQGIAGLYAGLSAALTRQVVYTTLRLGLYDIFKAKMLGPSARPSEVTFAHRAAIGLASGGVASFISCPIEVCLVRMQADGRLPKEQRRGYRHIGDALLRIAREEGIRTYWRGATPTVCRAMVVAMTQISTYDQAKSMLVPRMGDNVPTHITAALAAAVIYSYASLPLDTAKTRMQNQDVPKAGQQLQYRGMAQTLASIARTEGVRSLWKGFTPYFARSGGHTVLMFLFKEQYEKLANKFCANK